MINKLNQIKRKRKIRAKIKGTKERPRLTIYRGSKYIYAQIIDDEKGHTICAAYTGEIEEKSKKDAANKNESAKRKSKKCYKSMKQAEKLGEIIAEKAVSKNIKTLLFDRNGYIYHGNLKAFAEGAREGGLKF